MWNKVSSVLIGLFWIAVFGYLIYKGLYAVTIISLILIGSSLAMDPSSGN